MNIRVRFDHCLKEHSLHILNCQVKNTLIPDTGALYSAILRPTDIYCNPLRKSSRIIYNILQYINKFRFSKTTYMDINLYSRRLVFFLLHAICKPCDRMLN